MSNAEKYGRGYTGHDRGVVVTNDGYGIFSERPMSLAELAAREPAWTIGADPHEFFGWALLAGYYRCWEVIAAAINIALAEQAKAHDARCTELLAANTVEVERRRRAEDEAELWRRGFYSILKQLPPDDRDPGAVG